MTAPTIEPLYDIEIEQLMDDDVCCVDSKPATHTHRHGGCLAYICSQHAEIARTNILLFPTSMLCGVCHQPIPAGTLEVTPI